MIEKAFAKGRRDRVAATLTTERVFQAFLGGPEQTLYYGHGDPWTGGAAAAVAQARAKHARAGPTAGS